MSILESHAAGSGVHDPIADQPCGSKPCGAQHCLGCPAVARDVLQALLAESTAACGFDSITIEARAALPASWPSQYTFAIVRRGYVIRQRVDAGGRTTAVDAVGAGGCFPVDGGAGAAGRAGSNGNNGRASSGYALTRSMVCLCDAATLARSLEAGGMLAAQVHQLDSEALARVERLTEARGRSGAASKVAALLCTLADTLRPASPRETTIPSEFLQRDFAALLSIRHESVCRVLRDFSDRGLVEKTAEGLVLADRAALEAM